MDVFECAACGTELTAPVSRVALPVHTYYGGWEELHPPLMEPATYAVDPLPTGPPWRSWEEVGADEAARRGVFAPVYRVSFGARDRIVIAPGDSRSMTLIPDRCEGYCRGVDGRAGPNLACEGCGRAVATRMDDCGMWQTVWLEPDTVVRRPSGLTAGPPPDWDDLLRAEHRVPPVEPDGSWSRRWEAAIGVALAHLVAVTEGHPVRLPAGPVAELLGHAVGRYLPAGPDPRSVGPAGPGIHLPRPRPDVLLVPRHPLTGAPWRPPGDEEAVVPLDSGVWAYLVHPGETSPMPATGVLPEGVLRDDYPLPPRPLDRLTPHHQAFGATLARLPAVRSPRLRDYLEKHRPGLPRVASG
ncbi:MULTISPECIES: hypothetical protein [Streptomyces]|uniref:hypothetical protein n=1 Tax=Streptomyces TaxID=1883 RepID=UPI0008F1E0A0|nr:MULTISPECIES: hypothetical protein [unclassified Streptomyces]UJV46277.1 hypothetical protein CVT30_46310 [Streptomyces sp. AMCC400023]SFN44030.1 hypothetical protein SAMN04487980_102025 [Streptomyces sp. cf124]